MDAYCVMPNHIHLVCKPLIDQDGASYPLQSILHSLKRYTALQANRILARKGAFWQHESYDHVVRDEGEWRRIIAYVLNNPVAAGLVASQNDWRWLYCRTSF